MLSFRQYKFNDQDVLTAETYQREVQTWLSTWNGGLSWPNIPYNAITANKTETFTNTQLDSVPDGSVKNTLGVFFPTQSYFKTTSSQQESVYSRQTVNDEFAFLSLEHLHEFKFFDASWQTGFISLVKYQPEGTYMRVPCKRGTLIVSCNIDIECLYAGGTQGDDPPAVFLGGRNWTYGIGIWVDGRCVASTGDLPWGRRRTHNLTSSLSVESGLKEIEIRAWFKIDRYRPTPGEEEIDWDNWSVYIYNSSMYGRNQYR